MHKQKEKNASQNNGYVWNTLAGLLNAGESVILSSVATRTLGLSDAGILSIAFAIGNLMMTVGKFGVRSYQATDIQETYSFSDYFWARILTVGLMAALSILYLVYCIREKGYTDKKAAVILAICAIYAVESVEDVFWGLYQQKQALDYGAKIFIVRWVSILTVFAALLLVKKDLPKASASGFLLGLIVFVSVNHRVFLKFHKKIGKMHWKSIRMILRQCFPLFAVSFLSFYVTNAPKYSIDEYLTQDVQACYGFLAMPVFVVGLLNGFLYQPSLVAMAVEWEQGRIQKLCLRVKRQCVILCLLTASCLTGAYICGIPVLSALFAADLSAYQTELLLLVFGGGLYACAGYFSVLLTIMRKQRQIMYGYAGTAALALLLSDKAVRAYGVMGAAVFYTILMAVLTACIYCLYQKGMREKKNMAN